MQDEIKREVIIKAPKEDVYDAIANPEKVVQWFPDAVEGAYAAGEDPVFVFKGEKAQIRVVEAKPHEYFAYRWVPGGSDFIGDLSTVPNTLVEFRISENADGTCTVAMTESGFASLPEDTIENALKGNSEGWDFMLGRLEKFFQQG